MPQLPQTEKVKNAINRCRKSGTEITTKRLATFAKVPEGNVTTILYRLKERKEIKGGMREGTLRVVR